MTGDHLAHRSAGIVPASVAVVSIDRPQGESVAVQAAPAPAGPGWSWLPSLIAVAAAGLLLVAIADSGARLGAWWADPVFWIGVGGVFGLLAARLASAAPTRDERLGLVIVLGLALYLVKVLHSPLGFTFHDEFLHWRTADDILVSGHLYGENPLLPVSALYPGLEIVTSALAGLGGLTIFEAGLVLGGLARLLLVVAMFHLYEDIGGSGRVAGLAGVLYMANPNFVFFDAQYSYESLALPLAALALLAARRWAHGAGGRRASVAWSLVFIGALWATAITHHLTSYALAGFLVLWWLSCIRRAGRRETLTAATAAVLAVGACLAWLVSAGGATFGYLAPVLSGGVSDLVRWLTGQTQLRRLFSDFSGQRSPLWEQLVGFMAVGLILLGLPFGLLQIWRRRRSDAMTVALGIVVLAYPATLALRLTEGGAETSNRSSEFLFAGIAFVLAIGAVERWLPPEGISLRGARWTPVTVLAGWVTLLFMGGVIVGWGPVARLPGPYLVGADTRSVEPEGIAVAATMLNLSGPGQRIAADRTNRLLLGSFGRQRPVSAFADWVGISPLYFSPTLGPEERNVLRRGRIRYVMVDRRLSSGLPAMGVYIELGEADTFRHTTPIEPAALAKFENVGGADRILDSGDIVVYDVKGLVDGR